MSALFDSIGEEIREKQIDSGDEYIFFELALPTEAGWSCRPSRVCRETVEYDDSLLSLC